MAWKKPPPRVVAAFDAALPRDARVERRQMFGYPCAFVNRNLFGGLHESKVIVRLPEARRTALLAARRARRFAPLGRVMREYVVLPRAEVADPRALRSWVGEAFRYAAALPPKPARAGARAARPAKGDA